MAERIRCNVERCNNQKRIHGGRWCEIEESVADPTVSYGEIVSVAAKSECSNARNVINQVRKLFDYDQKIE